MVICVGEAARAPEVSCGTHLLRTAGLGVGGRAPLSEVMVQPRLCYLLLAVEKIFFKWKQIKRANGKPVALVLFFPINQG